MKSYNAIKKELQKKSIRQLVANFRNEYLSNGISDKEITENPIILFEKWFNEAVKNNINEPNVMHLSTISLDNKPAGRVVLLKGFDERGFVFYTNYDSRKGRELEKNNFAAATFLWLELYKQVRIEGVISKVSSEESDQYFGSRPRGSQIGAWASMQSQLLSNKQELEKRVKEFDAKFKNTDVPRPENWGGYRLEPTNIEFWLGRASRLHDRIKYELKEDKTWNTMRLQP